MAFPFVGESLSSLVGEALTSGASLTDTALAGGYFDQAHFIHDFKAVTGLTPGGYLGHVRQRYGALGEKVIPLHGDDRSRLQT